VKRRGHHRGGVDQVAVDAFGATLLGLRAEDIGYVWKATRAASVT